MCFLIKVVSQPLLIIDDEESEELINRHEFTSLELCQSTLSQKRWFSRKLDVYIPVIFFISPISNIFIQCTGYKSNLEDTYDIP